MHTHLRTRCLLSTLVGALALFVVGASHAGTGLPSGVSLTVLEPTPNQVIVMPTLAIHVLANGYRLDARYAGTPNQFDVGHYHEILDGALVDMTPQRDGNRDVMSMVGVSPGQHVLTLVPANNDHSTVQSAAVNIPFVYAGPYLPLPSGSASSGPPAITIVSPAGGSTVQGGSFMLTASITNYTISGDCFGKELVAGVGHWHIFADQVDMAHMLTMAGGPSQAVSLKGLEPGMHTFYAVLTDNHHMPIMPMRMASVMLNVRSGN